MDPEQSIPLVIAANRDEFYDRQGETAQPRDGDPYNYVAPRDPEAGGTWIGINEEGLFVSLTNQPTVDTADHEKSRGRIVRDLLENANGIHQVEETLNKLELNSFGSYSLVAVGPGGILSHTHELDGDARMEHYQQGNFVLSSEKGFELIETGEWDRFPWRTNSGREDTDKLRGRLQSFCKQTDSFRHRDTVCRKGEEFGTLSSTLVILDRSRPELFFDFSQGAPCDSAYKGISVSPEFKSSVFRRWDQ